MKVKRERFIDEEMMKKNRELEMKLYSSNLLRFERFIKIFLKRKR